MKMNTLQKLSLFLILLIILFTNSVIAQSVDARLHDAWALKQVEIEQWSEGKKIKTTLVLADDTAQLKKQVIEIFKTLYIFANQNSATFTVTSSANASDGASLTL